jgi:predicted DsbA family dithiol-disulfide isomerase
VDDLKKYAQEMGLKADQFNACLDSSKYAGEIEKDLQEGQNAGVSATPSFFINGLPVSGAVPYERFKEMVEVALKQGQASKSAN